MDHFGQFALSIADEYDRPSGREDSVELARHDQSLERRQQAHPMHVGRSHAVAQRRARLVREKPEVLETPIPHGALQLDHSRAGADHQKYNVLEVTERERSAQYGLIFVCAAEIAGVSDHELIDETESAAKPAFGPGQRLRSIAVSPILYNSDSSIVDAPPRQQFAHARP